MMKSIYQVLPLVWIISAIGLWTQLTLATADARLWPVPLHDQPLYWIWLASPSIAWSLASIGLRKSIGAVFVLIVGALITELGGWWIIWSDAHATKRPGGMNPFSVQGLTLAVMISALIQWICFAVMFCVALLIWWRHLAHSRLTEQHL